MSLDEWFPTFGKCWIHRNVRIHSPDPIIHTYAISKLERLTLNELYIMLGGVKYDDKHLLGSTLMKQAVRNALLTSQYVQ